MSKAYQHLTSNQLYTPAVAGPGTAAVAGAGGEGPPPPPPRDEVEALARNEAARLGYNAQLAVAAAAAAAEGRPMPPEPGWDEAGEHGRTPQQAPPVLRVPSALPGPLRSLRAARFVFVTRGTAQCHIALVPGKRPLPSPASNSQLSSYRLNPHALWQWRVLGVLGEGWMGGPEHPAMTTTL